MASEFTAELKTLPAEILLATYEQTKATLTLMRTAARSKTVERDIETLRRGWPVLVSRDPIQKETEARFEAQLADLHAEIMRRMSFTPVEPGEKSAEIEVEIAPGRPLLRIT